MINRFTGEEVRCSFETLTLFPLIVSPCKEGINFSKWAKAHRDEIAGAVKDYGAVVFSGFGLDETHFHKAFKAATGMSPATYKGDTPRAEVGSNIYLSTAVAPGHALPLHQEVSAGDRKDMPKYISFFCVTPPAAGTGQTLVGSAKSVSDAIQRQMPHLWTDMTSKTLTYIARYLPTDSQYSKWIRSLNPSHATIEQRFGTEERSQVEAKCIEEGLTCTWDGEWAVVSRSGIPATIDVDGVTLFCNQIHVDKLSPTLCGGQLNYVLATTVLYPTTACRQFDVQFDDGTEITSEDAASLLAILKENEVGRDWKAGDLMIVDNVTMMHAKSPHEGERKVLVAMAGSIEGNH